jgi:pimeloyl-ACP methyl ester carboxylesterase
MATVTPNSGKQSGSQAGNQRAGSQRRTAPSVNPPEVVDPVWLIKAIGVAIVAAVICGYLTLCLLFYQGQWQLVLHPDRSQPAPSSLGGEPLETVHFGVDDSGVPQLTGWWLPAAPGGRYAAQTLLYLPSGDGSLAAAQSRLAALHSLGINIFAFDYRGYGQSAPTHPNQKRMTDDANSAWQYLTVSRGIHAESVVLFGDGVGAALAAQLASAHAQVPAVVMQAPRADLLQIVLGDPRTRSLPVRALFHESFDIATATVALKTPKLFLLPERSSAIAVAKAAADPKIIVTLPVSEAPGPLYLEQLARFLDQIQHNYP